MRHVRSVVNCTETVRDMLERLLFYLSCSPLLGVVLALFKYRMLVLAKS